MTQPIVAVIGSANYDLVFRTGSLPVPGQTILGGAFSAHAGGKGANQAAAIARLGGHVYFVGCIGDDLAGKALRSGLEESGVDTSFLLTDAQTPSGTAAVIVDDEGRNQIVVAPGANDCVTVAQVEGALATLSPNVTLSQLEIPMRAVMAASFSPRFILNPAPASSVPPEIFTRCEILTPNEGEAEDLTGIRPDTPDRCRAAAAQLLDLGADNVVITLGENGCFWMSPRGAKHFPAPTVRAIDTVAAGDAFSGALALFCAQGRSLENSIPLANCVGALATTRAGAVESLPTLAELIAFAGDLY